jgi:hypothetical protein
MSAGKTLIGGVDYTIKGGKTLIGGVDYTIKGGKTLIGGADYTISFGVAMDLEDLLIDFEYTLNDDGTATLTAWKGTLNGVASTELVIPDDDRIIL